MADLDRLRVLLREAASEVRRCQRALVAPFGGYEQAQAFHHARGVQQGIAMALEALDA